MNILMPCKTRADTLRTAKEILEKRGHRCTILPWESALKLQEKIKEGSFDTLLCAESAVLPRRTVPIRTVYLASAFFCPDKFPASGVSLCLIPHEELAFAYITHGAKDKSIRVCGVPLRDTLLRRFTRAESCRALGISEQKTIFLVIGDAVSASVLKSLVSAVRTFCADTQILLLGTGEARRKGWMSAFAADSNVFVSEMESCFSLALSAADAVFVPAFAPLVCAAARQGKVLTLLHSAVPRTGKNAEFLDACGAAFRGKTTADNVSYACRLLESARLHGNMRAAQEKMILPDAEARLVQFLEE